MGLVRQLNRKDPTWINFFALCVSFLLFCYSVFYDIGDLAVIGLAVLFAEMAGANVWFMYKEWQNLPKPTKKEIAEKQRLLEEKKQYNLWLKAAVKETKYLQKRIPQELALQNNLQYKLAKKTGILGKRKAFVIKFPDALIRNTEVWFPIQSRYFPPGVGYHNILGENYNVIPNLEKGINRHCRIEIDQKYHHVYLVVSFRNSIGGLPLIVHWKETIKALDPNRKFAVVLGVDKANRTITQDLTKWPHGLVLGGTGNGKTTFIKQALITLLRRNTPQDLKFVLIDLKRTEFSPFREIPHIEQYVDDPDDAIEILKSTVGEMDRRYELFTDRAIDIDQYNKLPGKHMHRLFVWVDELALLTRGGDPKRRKEAISLILRLVALGRSAGINVLMGTQSVSKDVLTMDVTANVDGRLCFSVRNMSASILAIGNGDAVGLKPPGRCAIVRGAETVYLQSPIAYQSDIDYILRGAKQGYFEEDLKPPEKEKLKTIEDLVGFISDHMNGRIHIKDIHYEAGGMMALHEISRLIKENTDKPITINGKTYLIPPVGKRMGRGTKQRYLEVSESEIAKEGLTTE